MFIANDPDPWCFKEAQLGLNIECYSIFAMFFRQTAVVLYQIKQNHFLFFLSCCVFTAETNLLLTPYSQ